MTRDQEQKFLQSLYDRLFDAITYSPGGDRSAAFDRSTTFVQFSGNEALNGADFANAMSPINPTGDQRSALAFSQMVDRIPCASGEFAPSGRTVSKTYQEIVNKANTATATNPAQKATYDKASGFLNTTISVPNFDGLPTVTIGPSAIVRSYEDNQAAYITALSGYRTAQNGYDLSRPAHQRAFQAAAPALQLNIDKAWNTWVRQGKQNVERAQNARVAAINDIVSSVIASAQSDMSDQHWLAGLTPAHAKWMLGYARPSDWATNGSAATDFSINSSYLCTQIDSAFTNLSAGGLWRNGLWSVGGSVSGSAGSTNYHLDANNVAISAKLQTVRIMRPWLNALLFAMQGWWLENQPANAISNGTVKGSGNSILPLIPTAIIVAKDVTISADFSAQDRSHIESAVNGSVRIGWGPFAVGGSFSHSESPDSMKTRFDGAKLFIPEVQILAWVSIITPASPPMAAPAAASAKA